MERRLVSQLAFRVYHKRTGGAVFVVKLKKPFSIRMIWWFPIGLWENAAALVIFVPGGFFMCEATPNTVAVLVSGDFIVVYFVTHCRPFRGFGFAVNHQSTYAHVWKGRIEITHGRPFVGLFLRGFPSTCKSVYV